MTCRRQRTRAGSAAAAAAVALALAAGGCNLALPGWPALQVGTANVDCAAAWIDARTALLQAAGDPDPLIRTHAIEAMGETLGADGAGVYLQALEDRHPAVRFAGAMVVGDVEYAPAKARLAGMAGDVKVEADRRVLCAVLYALHQLGEDRYTSELGKLLFDREAEVRADAAMAVGKMRLASPAARQSAISLLNTVLGDELDRKVRWQVRESLAMLNDPASILRLEGYARQPDVELRLAAISALGRVRSSSARLVLRGLLAGRHDPRVRVAAAGTLARLGDAGEAAYQLCLDALDDPGRMLSAYGGRSPPVGAAEASSLQQLAARSLGWMGRRSAVRALQAVLRTPKAAGAVRVAAAMSVLRLCGRAEAKGAGREGGGGGGGRRRPGPTGGGANRRRLRSAGAAD